MPKYACYVLANMKIPIQNREVSIERFDLNSRVKLQIKIAQISLPLDSHDKIKKVHEQKE